MFDRVSTSKMDSQSLNNESESESLDRVDKRNEYTERPRKYKELKKSRAAKSKQIFLFKQGQRISVVNFVIIFCPIDRLHCSSGK